MLSILIVGCTSFAVFGMDVEMKGSGVEAAVAEEAKQEIPDSEQEISGLNLNDYRDLKEAITRLCKLGLRFKYSLTPQKIADILKDQGMDPDATVEEGYTALFSAVRDNNLEIVKVLIAAGADVNARGGKGVMITALREAVRKGNREIVAAIIAAPGFDPKSGGQAESAFSAAETLKHGAIAALIAHKCLGIADMPAQPSSRGGAAHVNLDAASLAGEERARAVSAIENHPLMNDRNLALLNKLANKISDEIDRMFPAKKQVLVGLGQSPAYLLEMIKLIDEQKHRSNRQYLNVAFSGGFYGSDVRGLIDPRLAQEFKERAPYYRRYLEKVGLSEEDFNETDTKFIVVEVCHTCQGLQSFLYFFEDYTKKPFVLYLQSEAFEPARLSFPSDRFVIDRNEEKLMLSLAEADEFEDRIVPHFAYFKWDKIDPLTFKPEKNAPVIMKQIRQFIEETYGNFEKPD